MEFVLKQTPTCRLVTAVKVDAVVGWVHEEAQLGEGVSAMRTRPEAVLQAFRRWMWMQWMLRRVFVELTWGSWAGCKTRWKGCG